MSTREKWLRILGPLVLLGAAFVAHMRASGWTFELATLAACASTYAIGKKMREAMFTERPKKTMMEALDAQRDAKPSAEKGGPS